MGLAIGRMPAIEHPMFAHDFRGRPSACVGCDRLRRRLTATELAAPCDGPRWTWTVTGSEWSAGGNMVRGYEDSGVVLGMTYVDAVANLPLDELDTDDEFTITLRRIDDDGFGI
jgi:hypothetical protein